MVWCRTLLSWMSHGAKCRARKRSERGRKNGLLNADERADCHCHWAVLFQVAK